MLFTIITISRNNREGLARTAQSLQLQEYSDFEWIIIDGNSDDGTDDDFESYDATIISEDDAGPYDAMNKGLALATGEYVLFLNSGDRLAQTQTLKKIKEAVSLSKPDFIYGDAWEFSEGRTWYKPARPHTKVAKGMFTHHQAMLYKNSLVKEQCYDLSYKIAADYEFTVLFLNKARTCLYLAMPICVFEAGGISQTNVSLGRKEQFIIRRKTQIVIVPKNVAIYAAQMVSWGLRSCAPRLYWQIKNIRSTDTSQTP